MIAIWIVVVVALASTSAIEVTTSLGAIRGVTLKTPLGRDIYAFRGIRYANAPVGKLRFKNPQPVDPWKPKVFDALDGGPICPQTRCNSSDYSEDCLRINVYTKNLNAKTLKKVVMYLNPGGFYADYGWKSCPVCLMDQDYVLVTMNYRLGMLGFLATGTPDAPGNAGLKDQVVAFRWVSDHIHNFGGDPHSVILMDYSEGSLGTGLHMASPMSKGLFYAGFAMIPSSLTLGKYPHERLHLATLQAKLVNCPTHNIRTMVKCLRKTSVDEFVRTTPALVEFGYKRAWNWMGVIEKDFGQERFLTEDPTKSYQSGRFEMVPLTIIMPKDEFTKLICEFLLYENQTQYINENWETQSPICLKYEQHSPKPIPEDCGVVRNEYAGHKLGRLFFDSVFTFDHLAARYVPIHYSQFSYKHRYHLVDLTNDSSITLFMKVKI